MDQNGTGFTVRTAPPGCGGGLCTFIRPAAGASNGGLIRSAQGSSEPIAGTG